MTERHSPAPDSSVDEYLTEMIDRLQDAPDFKDDRDLIVSLSCCHEKSAPVLVPALAEALERSDKVGYHDLLVDTFAQLGPSMVRMGQSRHAVIRLCVAKAARRTKPVSNILVETLVQLLADPDAEVRKEACQSLAEVCPTRASAQLLIQRLDDESQEVVEVAIRALGVIGPEAVDGVPRLVQFLDSGRGQVNNITSTYSCKR